MVRSVDLSDYMLLNPAMESATDDLFQAIDSIVEHRISGVCVDDHDRMLVGVLSEMDCLRERLGGIYNAAADAGQVVR
jgi:CBS domain-containing protein